MIAGFSLYQLACYFVLYSFLGWCAEVVFCTVTRGQVVNRGFLNGPVCPIYGFGMLAVLLLTRALGSQAADGADVSLPALFFGGMLLASTVELAAGWLMLKLFHARWWDYRNKPFNIGGFVCLQFSLLWGLAAVLAVRVLHPLVAQAAHAGPAPVWGWPVLAVIYAIYAADLVVTLITVAGLNRDLRELDRVAGSLRTVSEALSTGLGTGALETDRRLDEGRLQMTLAKAEARDAVADAVQAATRAAAEAKASAQTAADAARENAAAATQAAARAAAEAKASAQAAAQAARDAYAESLALLEARADVLRADVLNKRHFGGGRLLKAFPDMDHAQYRSILQDLQARMDQRLNAAPPAQPQPPCRQDARHPDAH